MVDELVALLPLIFLLVFASFFGWLSRKSYKKHADRVEAVNADIIEINREMLAELREIRAILKGRE